jgi:hypothetical protein
MQAYLTTLENRYIATPLKKRTLLIPEALLRRWLFSSSPFPLPPND